MVAQFRRRAEADQFLLESNSRFPLGPSVPRRVKVICGCADGIFDGLVGATVASVQAALVDAFNVPRKAIAFVKGKRVSRQYRLRANDVLEFVKRWCRKGVGSQVWTDEEFCKYFKITRETLQAWIAQGLKVKTCLDGSVRITETAVDEFFRGRVIESPYLNTEQAAAYCNVSKDAFYGRVERKRIKPLPGSGKENLFTRDQCDKMMKGEQA